MKLEFIPVDYDYFDFEGKNYAKIIGRNQDGKRVCIIDFCDVYFWAILKDKLNEKEIKKLKEKIEKIQINMKGRQTKVEKVEIHNKKFLGKDVKALKIFATNYKDLHDIADKLGMPEIIKRRGYDLGFVSHYIIEKNIHLSIKNFQIQFHNKYIDNPKKRMISIQEKLMQTHELTWQFEFVWENWRIRK